MKSLLPFISRLFFVVGFSITIKRIVVRDFYDFRNLLIRLKDNDDIRSYSDVLNKVTNEKYRNVRFVGSGGGDATTKTHTIIKKHKELIFEKVFFINSREYKFIKKNYNYIKQELQERNIIIPALVNLTDTQLVGICNFEYLDNLVELEANDFKYQIELAKIIGEVPNNFSNDEKEYLLLPNIKSNFSNLVFQLINEPTLDQFLVIKKFVDVQKVVFTHGDFHERNIFKNYVIDWDDAGFYPFGIDVARILYANSLYLKSLSTKENFSVNDFFEVLEEFDFSQMEKIAIVYFFIIFTQPDVYPATASQWIKELYVVTLELTCDFKNDNLRLWESE